MPTSKEFLPPDVCSNCEQEFEAGALTVDQGDGLMLGHAHRTCVECRADCCTECAPNGAAKICAICRGVVCNTCKAVEVKEDPHCTSCARLARHWQRQEAAQKETSEVA